MDASPSGLGVSLSWVSASTKPASSATAVDLPVSESIWATGSVVLVAAAALELDELSSLPQAVAPSERAATVARTAGVRRCMGRFPSVGRFLPYCVPPRPSGCPAARTWRPRRGSVEDAADGDPAHRAPAQQEVRDDLAGREAARMAGPEARDRLAAHTPHPAPYGALARADPHAARRPVPAARGRHGGHLGAALEEHGDAAAVGPARERAEVVGSGPRGARGAECGPHLRARAAEARPGDPAVDLDERRRGRRRSERGEQRGDHGNGEAHRRRSYHGISRPE